MGNTPLTDAFLDQIVGEILRPLYENRIKKLKDFDLADILGKNIFMLRALGINTPASFVANALSAFMSSSDETKFGAKFFEPIVTQVSRGNVTDVKGMDVVIERELEHILLTIKSGPNWGNGDAWNSIARHFSSAERSYRTHANRKRFLAVVGQCYGKKTSTPNDSRAFHVMSGQHFWAYLTGEENFYLRLLHSIGRVADAHKQEFDAMLEITIQRLTVELLRGYCTENGLLDWDSIAHFNSAME